MIDKSKLMKIGTQAGNMIVFANLQRFVDYELSKKGFFSKYNAKLTYNLKLNKWFGNNAFNETEKQEMIQAILNYEPSDNEIKTVPHEIIAPAPRKKLSAEEAARCRKFDARNDGDEHYLGY